MKVSRSDIADYLNVSKTATADWSFMGAGYNSLNESPGAQTEEKIYISDKTSSSTIKSYKTQFAFDTDYLKGEKSIDDIISIARNHEIGSAAEREYCRVDLFDPVAEGETDKFKARKFKVAVEVSSMTGGGGETVTASGNLNCVGDPIQGWFDTTTKTFTEGAYVATP